MKPGQAAPTDGVVLKGASEVNQAPVTGESAPVAKEPGSQIFAASLIGDGALEVRATRAFADSTLSRVIHLVEEAQEQKGKSQRLIERFGNVYSPLVLGAGVLLGLVPFVLGTAEPREWLARATVFVVAAAPCALVISIPITMVAALGTGARQGVLVKGGRHLEELARVRVVAFYKTGTLTVGRPTVVGEARRPWLIVGTRDQVRPGAAAAVRSLREAGIERVAMLSGDHPRAAHAVAAVVGIEEVLADLDPAAKLESIGGLVAAHRHVAMVGDCIKDAPALAKASVGIAMGAAGSDVALEAADIALMSDDLSSLEYAFGLARRTTSVVRQNLALSSLVIGSLVVLAVTGALSLPGAVIAHELSEFVVIASGLRMLRA